MSKILFFGLPEYGNYDFSTPVGSVA